MDLSATLPDVLVGAWHRTSVQVGDAAPVEPARVLWLQSADVFADLRLPREGASGPFGTLEAFAGTTTWHPGTAELSWAHDVDLTGTFAGVDRARVDWLDDDTMIERGTVVVAGAPCEYGEVWTRAGAGEARGVRTVGPDGTTVRVEVGAVALTVAADGSGAVRAELVAHGRTIAVVDAGGTVADTDAFDALVAGGVVP